MTISYKFKVLAMSEDKLKKEAVAVAEAGDMEKLKYLLHNYKKSYEVQQAIINAEADLPDAVRFFVNEKGYSEYGKHKLLWDLTLVKGNKTKTVEAVIETGMTMDQHMKDTFLANALYASDGSANSPMAEMLIQKGADLDAATALLKKGQSIPFMHRPPCPLGDQTIPRRVRGNLVSRAP